MGVVQVLDSSRSNREICSKIKVRFLYVVLSVAFFAISTIYAWDASSVGDSFKRGFDEKAKAWEQVDKYTNQWNSILGSPFFNQTSNNTYLVGSAMDVVITPNTGNSWRMAITAPKVRRGQRRVTGLRPIISYESSASGMTIDILTLDTIMNDLGSMLGSVWGSYLEVFFNITSPTTIMAYVYGLMRLGMDVAFAYIAGFVPYSSYLQEFNKLAKESEALALAVNDKVAEMSEFSGLREELLKNAKKPSTSTPFGGLTKQLSDAQKAIREFGKVKPVTASAINAKTSIEIMYDFCYQGPQGKGIFTYTPAYLASKSDKYLPKEIVSLGTERVSNAQDRLKNENVKYFMPIYTLSASSISVKPSGYGSDEWKKLESKIQSFRAKITTIVREKGVNDSAAIKSAQEAAADAIDLIDTYMFSGIKFWDANAISVNSAPKIDTFPGIKEVSSAIAKLGLPQEILVNAKAIQTNFPNLVRDLATKISVKLNESTSPIKEAVKFLYGVENVQGNAPQSVYNKLYNSYYDIVEKDLEEVTRVLERLKNIPND